MVKTKNTVSYPSIDEVVEYFKTLGITDEIIAKKWYYTTDAVGWKIGKNPIVNWKSAVSAYVLELAYSNNPTKEKDLKDRFSNSKELDEALRKYYS